MKLIIGEAGDPVFFCPGCRCEHKIRVRHPNETTGATWSWNGSLSKPTFAPSILITSIRWDPPVTQENLEQWRQNPWPQQQVAKTCHSYVREGRIEFLPDCTHELAGQTVELPEHGSDN